MKTKFALIRHGIILLLLAIQIPTVFAQGTAFSYQGRLNDGAAPANGHYDIAFTLFNVNSNGVAIAGPVTNSATGVTNGLFTVAIDFGSGVFNGNSYWLEIAVRTNGGSGFTTLTPRQPVTPTPYAIFANTASNLSGTISTAQLPPVVITNGASGVNMSGTFTGSGAGLANVPGTMPWQISGAANVTASANQAYLLTNTNGGTITLPSAPNVGDIVTVSANGSGGWQAYPNSGQFISELVHWPGEKWVAQNAGIDNGGNLYWQKVASSSNGVNLVAVADNDYIYTSADAGGSWMARSNGLPNGGVASWISVASSADGTTILAGTIGDYLYISTNSGSTWTQSTNGIVSQGGSGWEYWIGVAVSADGSKLVAVDSQFSNGGYIYVSHDSGATWMAESNYVMDPSSPNGPGTANWTAVASSADGSKLIAIDNGSLFYTSTNSGLTWHANTNALNSWSCVACSADGTHLIAGTWGDFPYTSIDSGATWTALTNGIPGDDWYAVASSANGSTLLAGSAYSGFFLSTNAGVSWAMESNGIPNSTSWSWSTVATSADGRKLLVAALNSQLYTSDYAANPFAGTDGTSAQFQYMGNGVWQPVAMLGLPGLSVSSGTAGPSVTITNGVFNGVFSGDGTGLTLNTNLNASDATFLTENTPYGLVVSDGQNGNIAIQPLGGGNTGFQSINFNGAFNGGEFIFNTNKTRWRIFADQRGTTDQLVIDNYRIGHPLPPFLTILTNGFFGIGTNTPGTKLAVNGTVSATNFVGPLAGNAASATTALTARTATNVVSGIFITNTTASGAFSGSFNGTFTGNGSALTNVAAATATIASTANNVASGISITNASLINATLTSATLANATLTGATLTNPTLTNATLANGTISGVLTGRLNGNATTATTASNVVSGISLANAVLAGAYVTNSVFSGDGGGLANLNAANLTGQVPSSSLPAGVALLGAASQTFTGANTFQVLDPQQGLRVTDSSTNSNISIQPLAGGNSGFQAINFNGYFDGGEHQYNTGKNRWRIYVDQREDSDSFNVDNYFGGVGNVVLSIDTNGVISGNGSGLTGLIATQIPDLDASKITSGTIALALMPGEVVTNNATDLTLSGAFNGDGSGLTNLNASQISSGVIAPAQLPAVVVTNNQTSVTFSNLSISSSSQVAPLTILPRIPSGAAGSTAAAYYAVSIAVAGRYVYMVNGSDTLQIVDVNNPAAPVTVSTTATANGGNFDPYSVAVAGRYAYVVLHAAGSSAVQIFDISNPANPSSVGTNFIGTTLLVNLALQGRYLYAADESQKQLRVFDVGNPTSPVQVGSAAFGANFPQSVAVAGRYAYVAAPNYLQIYDISTPSSPVSVGSAGSDTGTFTTGSIAVVGRYAYLASGLNNNLQIFDVSNPSSPSSAGTVSAGSHPAFVTVAGRYAYVANQIGNSVQIFDVSTPSSPVSVGSISTGTTPTSVSVVGRYVYVANENDNSVGSLQVFDLGGAYIQQFEAGAIETGTLQTRDTATIGNNLDVRGGLTVSASARITGGLRVDNGIISGNGSSISNLNASNLSGGSVSSSLLTSVPAASLTGTIALAQLPSVTLTNSQTNVVLGGVFTGSITNAFITNSIFAGNGAGLTNLNASQISSGTLGLAQLPAAVVTNNESGVALSGIFTGGGGGLTNLNYNNITNPPAIPSTNGFVTASITNGLATTNYVTTRGYITSANGGNAALATNVVPGIAITNGVLTGAFVTNSVFAGNGSGLTNVNASSLGGTEIFTNGNGVVLGTTLNAAIHPIFLKAAGDFNHGVGYTTSTTNFNGTGAVDGPVLWGFGGGALATMNGTPKLELVWTPSGVGIGITNPAHLFQVGTNAITGAYCDGTTWVNGSDRNSKQDFSAVDPLEVLQKISAMPITQWQYKVEPDGVKHIGPMAQDFHAAFGLNGADDKHISTVDESGVALAAIQGLNREVKDLKEKLNRSDAENAELKTRLEKLEQLINSKNGVVK
jgi:uncharacterized protein YjbI with pentapeptide repeats